MPRTKTNRRPRCRRGPRGHQGAQLSLDLRRHGGKRKGAGRKPRCARGGVPHRSRGPITGHTPVHVTLKVAEDLPNLRHPSLFPTVREAIYRGADRLGLRVIHFCVQQQHLHLIVEAQDARALGRGMQGLSVRLARQINRAFGRRGRVFVDRYHSHVLRTPGEARACLAYVLNNFRRHGQTHGPWWVDPCSSGDRFTGWEGIETTLPDDDLPIGRPRSWLLRLGWLRAGRAGAGERRLSVRHTPAGHKCAGAAQGGRQASRRELSAPPAGPLHGFTTELTPEQLSQFQRNLPIEWIEEALYATGTATVRRRRLPAEQVVWLVLGMALMRDRALYGVDGSTLRVPDSDENRDHFGGQSAGQAGRGPSAYPLVRLAALMALRSHLLVGVSFGPYDNSKYVYASDLWSCVPDIVELNVSSVARAKDSSLPKTWRVRAITYQRKGYQLQTLLTSLLDAHAYPAEEIVRLYDERWEIELGYDELKTELLDREEAIRSQTVKGVKQELWGVFVAYNLVRLEIERIAEEADVDPVRISFVTALRYIRDEWFWLCGTRSPGAIPRHLHAMRENIKRFILPLRRQDRVYPRAVKIKMSNYPLNRRRPNGKPVK